MTNCSCFCTSFYNLAFCICCISFSSFMARAKLPWIFNFPAIKADVALVFPANISVKRALSIIRVQSAPLGDSPLPAEPAPFFRSKCQVPGCDPVRNNTFQYFLNLLHIFKDIKQSPKSLNGRHSAHTWTLCLVNGSPFGACVLCTFFPGAQMYFTELFYTSNMYLPSTLHSFVCHEKQDHHLVIQLHTHKLAHWSVAGFNKYNASPYLRHTHTLWWNQHYICQIYLTIQTGKPHWFSEQGLQKEEASAPGKFSVGHLRVEVLLLMPFLLVQTCRTQVWLLESSSGWQDRQVPHQGKNLAAICSLYIKIISNIIIKLNI